MTRGEYGRNFRDAVAHIEGLPASERSAVANRPVQRCWLRNDRPIRDDGPGIGAIGREQEAGQLIHCADYAATLGRALGTTKL